MFKFFIDRPILAASISTLIVVLGFMSLKSLPLANYPRVSPPSISVSAYYPGADALTVSESVAAVLERQINGAEGMLYIASKCFNNGTLSMTVTFDISRNDDLALVDVQNRVSEAESSLPQEVMRQGLTIRKQSPDMLMLINLYSPKGTVSDLDLANYASRFIKDELGRIKGVGDVSLMGADDYGMRIWLDPERLQHYNLTVSDVRAAVNDQNQLASAGTFGAMPSSPSVKFERTGQIKGQLTTPKEFSELVLRTNSDGSVVRLTDVTPNLTRADGSGNTVTRPGIELGAEGYDSYSRRDGKPSTSLIIYQLPSGNAVEISKTAKALMEKAKGKFLRGGLDMDYAIGLDMAEYVTVSLKELVRTLIEALVLVLIVVYLFLGSFRSSLVPMVAVPVSLIGVFAFFPLFGLNINNLTLFALVLAVGIVVDDAIVVVEAVEVRLDEGHAPREAAVLAMKDVGFTIVGITFALISVFLPMTMLGGLTGKLYQQFALTLALSVGISAFNSLTLSPALCALLLHSRKEGVEPFILVRLFNRFYDTVFKGYSNMVGIVARRGLITVALMAAVYAGLFGAMKALPTSLVPVEDQRVFFMAVQMPNGAAQTRTRELADALSLELKKALPEVESVTVLGAQNVATGVQSSSVATCVVLLTHWDERKGEGQDIVSVIQKAQALAREKFHEPMVMTFSPPTISGLGMSPGVTYEVENQGDDQSPEALVKPVAMLQEAFSRLPELAAPFTAFSMHGRFVALDVDREKAKRQGVNLSDVFYTVGTLLGGSYINDFQEFGHNYKVMMQARDDYRTSPEILRFFNLRNANGDLVPVSAFISTTDKSGPEFLTRYNLYPSIEFMAGAAPGHSTGQAMAAMDKAARDALPTGYGFEWTGQSYQEQLAAGQTSVVLALALICCFLVLAGLYESMTSPFVVMVSVGIAILGAMLGQLARGLTLDVFMQVGLVMLIGLAAKNAILIVQYAQTRQQEGLPPAEAAVLAGRQRLRPILMTSFAFILGVLPLVIATGAGANSRHSLGTGVFFGMMMSTFVGVFAIPGLYVLVQRIKGNAKGAADTAAPFDAAEKQE
ncbi:Hydrophobe/amphiphile efflux-1 (HAE1) family transporter [uncultured delta proteobacterium]|uniref:Hydrophobe/amphiphile efflux-1 (HAE1) family transporter n=1 Tax=uncultured delta proteobacterium TaxID=34034 RepID=A0A212KC24_9DELT|nr:Hydrophobe/amphiphile efflux-1 (HAE1) family transporter [uncultured delta proteobacterium]